MKTTAPIPAGFNRRQIVLAIGAMAGLSACGGGGGIAAVGSGGTGSFSGVITGFGSIIIHGVRYDDSVRITDDLGLAVPRANLRLGMVVAIADPSPVIDGRSIPGSIVVRSKLLGPIDSVTPATSSFVVLGQTVQVTGSTVFDADLAGGFAALTPRKIVEVYGLTQPGSLRATFIDDAPGATVFKLEGVVSNLNLTASTFSIGSMHMNYGGAPASDIRVALVNGATVRVRVNVTPINNVWTVTRIDAPERAPEEGNFLELTGPITTFVSATDFHVGGIPVDATRAAFPHGRAFLGMGAQVEAEGRMVNGVLQAVEVENDAGSSVTGRITTFNSATDFHVNGLPVNATAAAFPGDTVFLGLNAAVAVEGGIVNGVLWAVEIEPADLGDAARGATEITGAISAFASATDFHVGGIRVAFPYGIALFSVGAPVEVAGTMVGGVLQADEVKKGTPLEIEGSITEITPPSRFVVSGIPVSTTIPAPDFLRLGARVEVEGTMVGGTLQATEVSNLTDRQTFELYGTVTVVTPAGPSVGSFTLTSPGRFSVQVDWDATTIRPRTALANDDRIKVEGRSIVDGRMRASYISFQD